MSPLCFWTCALDIKSNVSFQLLMHSSPYGNILIDYFSYVNIQFIFSNISSHSVKELHNRNSWISSNCITSSFDSSWGQSRKVLQKLSNVLSLHWYKIQIPHFKCYSLSNVLIVPPFDKVVSPHVFTSFFKSIPWTIVSHSHE